MSLTLTHCVGRSSCPNPPTEARGLCAACYQRHRYHGTLGNFPTMRERVRELRARGQLIVHDVQRINIRRERGRVSSDAQRQRAYSERVLLDGFLVHPSNTHGRLYAYTTLGCRGPLCYASYRHYRATGASMLPETLHAVLGPEDCVMYVSDVYPDRRRKLEHSTSA
jgi:hypothetical protein